MFTFELRKPIVFALFLALAFALYSARGRGGSGRRRERRPDRRARPLGDRAHRGAPALRSRGRPGAGHPLDAARTPSARRGPDRDRDARALARLLPRRRRGVDARVGRGRCREPRAGDRSHALSSGVDLETGFGGRHLEGRGARPHPARPSSQRAATRLASPRQRAHAEAAGDAATAPLPRRRHHGARVPRLRADRDAAERARRPRRHRRRQHRRGARRPRAGHQGALLGRRHHDPPAPAHRGHRQAVSAGARRVGAGACRHDRQRVRPTAATRAREPRRARAPRRRARPRRRDGTSIRSSPPPGCGPRRATSHCSRSRSGGRGAARAIAC